MITNNNQNTSRIGAVIVMLVKLSEKKEKLNVQTFLLKLFMERGVVDGMNFRSTS